MIGGRPASIGCSVRIRCANECRVPIAAPSRSSSACVDHLALGAAAGTSLPLELGPQPVAQFGAGLLGERDGRDVGCSRMPSTQDERADPIHQRRGLARSGAGVDEQSRGGVVGDAVAGRGVGEYGGHGVAFVEVLGLDQREKSRKTGSWRLRSQRSRFSAWPMPSGLQYWHCTQAKSGASGARERKQAGRRSSGPGCRERVGVGLLDRVGEIERRSGRGPCGRTSSSPAPGSRHRRTVPGRRRRRPAAAAWCRRRVGSSWLMSLNVRLLPVLMSVTKMRAVGAEVDLVGAAAHPHTGRRGSGPRPVAAPLMPNGISLATTARQALGAPASSSSSSQAMSLTDAQRARPPTAGGGR